MEQREGKLSWHNLGPKGKFPVATIGWIGTGKNKSNQLVKPNVMQLLVNYSMYVGITFQQKTLKNSS